MKYDFILFENTRMTDNHYKDLENLAIMILKSGYSVAIADVFKEKEFCRNSSIPHLSISIKCPNGIQEVFKTSNKIANIYHQFMIFKYLKSVVLELLSYSDNIYIGSLFKSFPIIACLYLFPKNKNCFIWGLRSSALKATKFFRLSYVYGSILKKLCITKKNIKIIVSNELLLDEFNIIGIEKERLLLRPERVIHSLPEIRRITVNNELHLLSIGAIRNKKKVEQCLEALAKLNDYSIYYTIAGKSNTIEKEKAIEDSSKGVPNFKRINRRLNEEEYQSQIDNCDFIVLCDDNFDGGISSGTMNEALLSNKPIIASNCPTFSYFVEKYNVGLIYKWNDINSLASKIIEAKEKGPTYFFKSIRDYQILFLEQNVIQRFKNDLSIMLA